MPHPIRKVKGLESPIVSSLADTDFYKLTMLQFIWFFFADKVVTFRFKNRTNIPLGTYIDVDELRRQCQLVTEMNFPDWCIEKLREDYGHLFRDEFLDWLSTLQLPMPTIRIDEDNRLDISVTGSWQRVMLWETIVMNIVNRLYFLARMSETGRSRGEVWESGERTLAEKIAFFQSHPGLSFVDFGTRRRWSHDWHNHALDTFMTECPDALAGTSNMELGLKLGLKLVGTMAHEMDMGLQGVYFQEDDNQGYMWSHDELLRKWEDFYGGQLTIALSDTYGSWYFFKHFGLLAESWDGTRHDSGDPFTYGEFVIQWYERRGIDPRKKVLIFSDGLDHELMLRLYQRFSGRIKIGFGWGTKLTNDMGIEALKALSIVMKLVVSCGYGTVKLSDNPAKTQGDPDKVRRIIRLTGYDKQVHTYQECEV